MIQSNSKVLAIFVAWLLGLLMVATPTEAIVPSPGGGIACGKGLSPSTASGPLVDSSRLVSEIDTLLAGPLCRNDPVNNFDPLGLDWRWQFTGQFKMELFKEIHSMQGLARGEWRRPAFDWVWHPESDNPVLDAILRELAPKGISEPSGLVFFRNGISRGLRAWADETGQSLEALASPDELAEQLVAAFREDAVTLGAQVLMGDWMALFGDLSHMSDVATLKGKFNQAGYTVGHNGPNAAMALITASIAGRAKTAGANTARVGRFSRIETPWGRQVWQRADIDWSLVRPDGLTNIEATRRGAAPMRLVGGKWEDLQLHHLNQDVAGGLAEVWASTHRDVPHNVPPPSWRVTDPAAAGAYRREVPAYWTWRSNDHWGRP